MSFVVVPTSVLLDQDLTSAALRMLLVVASTSDEDGRVSGDFGEIIETTGRSRASVFAVLGELQDLGYLSEIDIDGRRQLAGNAACVLGDNAMRPWGNPGETEGIKVGVMLNASRVSSCIESLNQLSITSVQISTSQDLNKPYVLRSAKKLVDNPDAKRLCELLADRISRYNEDESTRPPLTQRWFKDMDLLLRRGPLHRAKPEPMPAERIERAIEFTFASLADPNHKGFCWAAQIRSPHALRDHWQQLIDAGRRAVRAEQKRDPLATPGQLVDRALGAPKARRSLLPPTQPIPAIETRSINGKP